MAFQIKTNPQDVEKFATQVAARADSDKDALGFLPSRTYLDAAYQGKLYVAVSKEGNSEKYAGHLMFGGVFPLARIFQLYVAPEYRGKSVARKLFEQLREKLSSQSWLSITAKVAADLAANHSWEKLGFIVARTVPGGSTRRRTINVRVFDLKTPSLFDFFTAKPRTSLRLQPRVSNLKPLYLMDLNVFFDVTKQRPRSVDAGKILRAGLENSIRLMIAEEFVSELKRTSYDTKDDPALTFAMQLNRLPHPPDSFIQQISPELASIIFSDRAAKKSLTVQDESDLLHLATAIHHKVTGFITSEKAILKAAITLREKYRIDIVGVDEFARSMTIDDEPAPIAVTTTRGSGTIMSRVAKNEDSNLIKTFLIANNALLRGISQAIADGYDKPEKLIVYESEKVVAYAHWFPHIGPQPSIDLFLCADENSKSIEGIVEYILDTIPIRYSKSKPCLIHLSLSEGHALTRQIAIARGFTTPEDQPTSGHALQRLYVNRVVTPENWEETRHQIQSSIGISLPKSTPSYTSINQTIEINLPDAQSLSIPLFEIERYLAPAILLLPGREAALVSIKHDYSEDLFRSAPQGSLLTPPEAILHRERVYISSARTRRVFSEGLPIMFYESKPGKGRGCIVAIARIVSAQVLQKSETMPKVQKRGVLTRNALENIYPDKEITEVTFDNVLVFNQPVALKKLRQIGCVDGSNLVRAKRVTFDHVLRIVREGVGHV